MAQDTQAIETAFKQGSAKALSKFFGQTVEIKILDTQDVYGDAQAEALLADFFKKNTPTDFKTQHYSARPPNAFMVGSLTTTNDTFRVNIFFKGEGANVEMTRLQIIKGALR